MATSYTTILKLALPATGELAGTWGDVVNQNITSMIEEAIAGLAVINTWVGASHTLTTANGTTSESRAAVLDLSGSPGGAATVICPDETKIYVVRNGVTGGFTATIKTSAGTGITIPNGRTAFVFCDGTNVELAADFMDVAEITTLTSTTGNITTVNATTVDTTNIEVTNLKAKDGTSAGSIADSTGVVTLASSVLTTTDINGGSIDGTTIGGSTPAAGTFTALTANGNVILGDAATDTVTVTADVASDLIPSVDGSFDLGASGAEWQDLFIDGTANIDSLVADTADINGGSIDGTTIGANTASTVASTNLSYTGTLTGSTGVINIGSGQVYKDASGNVGIGTSAPGFRTEIREDGAGEEYLLRLRRDNSTDQAFLDIAVDPDANLVTYNSTGTSSGSHRFITGNNERLRIDATTGNVGIGTSSPDARLHVSNGDIGVTPSLSADEAIFERNSVCGITLASPNDRECNIFFADPESNSVGRITYDHPTNAMELWTNDSERMVITSAGVVEINSGYVTLNGNQIGGIQVTIADDAFAEITPPRVGGGFVAVTTSGDNTFPDSAAGIAFLDWGTSPISEFAFNRGGIALSTAGPPTGTTGTDTEVTIFVGGTSGKLYLENRRGGTRTFQITFT